MDVTLEPMPAMACQVELRFHLARHKARHLASLDFCHVLSFPRGGEGLYMHLYKARCSLAKVSEYISGLEHRRRAMVASHTAREFPASCAVKIEEDLACYRLVVRRLRRVLRRCH